MLIRFFLELKDAQIPVSIREYLTLLEALKKEVIRPSMDEFYQLSKITLVKRINLILEIINTAFPSRTIQK